VANRHPICGLRLQHFAPATTFLKFLIRISPVYVMHPPGESFLGKPDLPARYLCDFAHFNGLEVANWFDE
jgi:hypothetical protein